MVSGYLYGGADPNKYAMTVDTISNISVLNISSLEFPLDQSRYWCKVEFGRASEPFYAMGSNSTMLEVMVFPTTVILSDSTGAYPFRGGTAYFVEGESRQMMCVIPDTNPYLGWVQSMCNPQTKAFMIRFEVPPKVSNILLSDSSGVSIAGDSVTVDEGTSYTFTCRAQSRPAATIQWNLGASTYPQSTIGPTVGEGDWLVNASSNWTFTPGRANHGQTVICLASTEDSYEPYPSDMVTLEVNGPPDTPVITGSPIVTENEPTVLTCTADMGYPQDWSLVWSIGSSVITGSTTSPYQSDDRFAFTSSLEFTPSRELSGEYISCAATRRITVEFNLDSGTVTIEGLKVVNGCIQLEVIREGSAAWQKCGRCIASDQTVKLSEWCASPEKRRRRAVADVVAVRARLCIGGLCSEAVPAKQVEDPPASTSSSINWVVVGASVGAGMFVMVFSIAIGVCARRRFKKRSNEMDTIGEPADQNQVVVPYSNVSMGHQAIPRDQLRSVRELGHGAFGRVFLAEARGITEGLKVTLVAVKTLQDGASKSDKADLMKELDLMKKLPDNANVVRLLGFSVEKDPPYIIVEYLSRGDLKTLLHKHIGKVGRVYSNLHGGSTSLTAKDLMKFAKDVADGMAFISSQQCIHRDLAARNVLVAEDMTCKVSDFGLARDVMNIRVYEHRSQGRLPLRWMAIESLIHDVYTAESDVWSYGVLLWEIVTLGARPYPAMTTEMMVEKLQSGYRMPKPKNCQLELYDMMLACWQEDPGDRPSFAMISDELNKRMNVGKECISMRDYEETIYEVTLPIGEHERV
ncbi:vascular endothelial growth factor receptor 2-like [Patiria miniata]|uniref:receptor protein-tyrosine kinase n=1 Tax=Patiria miniata TaxID=46514 RepID=A0A914AM70_PATMI|nr:vascular endothelial growth factor receptor 2-like [Patiria miniata]